MAFLKYAYNWEAIFFVFFVFLMVKGLYTQQSFTTEKRILQRKEGGKMNIKTFDQVKDEVIGLRGTERRDTLERELEALRLGIQIRNAREKQNLTQEQLAERINKKRTFISRIENDGSNLTIKTLLDIVERGLGGELVISVNV